MKTLIFDLDGTLADSKYSILESFNFALEKVGLSQTPFCEIEVTQQDLETSYRKICHSVQLPFDAPKCQLFIESYRKHQIDIAESFLKLFPRVKETLNVLAKDFVLAVATTKHSEQARRVLKSLEILDFFEHVQGTDSGLRYKPHPDILNKSLEVLKSSASESAYVGDAVHDMDAARAAQMIPIGAGYGFAGSKRLAALDLPHLIHCISDLLEIGQTYKASFSTKAI